MIAPANARRQHRELGRLGRFRHTEPEALPIDPLFTRDPAKIRDENVLMAMMAIAAVYEPYEVGRLNHGIGYATAAIELILPTYAAQRGLKGKIARHFVLNPHPTLIPAIETGFVDSVYCFGSELGMERYISSSTVEQRTLTPSILVRIQVPQPQNLSIPLRICSFRGRQNSPDTSAR